MINPYQTTPMTNYMPQYGAYNYNPMNRYQQQEQMISSQIPGSNQQMFGLNGRIVASGDQITANDVPMDSIAFFPKQDLSEIYVKQWGANGLINTVVYKPFLDKNNAIEENTTIDSEKLKIDLSDKATEGIMQRFDKLEEKILEIESSLTKSLTKSSSKSRVSQAEKESVES